MRQCFSPSTRSSIRPPSVPSILDNWVTGMQLDLQSEQLLFAPVAAAVASLVYVLYKILSRSLQSSKSDSNGKITSPPTAASELFDSNFDTNYTVQGNIFVTDGLAISTYRILRLLGVLALLSLHIFCVSTEYVGASSTSIGYALLAFYVRPVFCHRTHPLTPNSVLSVLLGDSCNHAGTPLAQFVRSAIATLTPG